MYVPQSIIILMCILVVAMAITILCILAASRNDRQQAEDALTFIRRGQRMNNPHKSVDAALKEVERMNNNG